MTISAYVLINAQHGRGVDVAEALSAFRAEGARVLSVDTVTGPYDVVARFEADNLDRLADAISTSTAKAPGVQSTLTCLSINLG